MYSLTFKAVVWNEQLEHEYVDDVTIGFYSDLTYEQMTKEIIEEIVEIYYADRDYPDFVRLLDYILTLIAKDKNILEMKLLDVICGKKYRSNYIRSYKDLVEGYDEKEHDGKCLNIMLQTNYKSLVDQRLIPREKLTDKYIDEYFGDDRTIKRLLEFVKELKHASIYVFDQIGKELIASHKATNERVTAPAIALVGYHHIECITDSNVKRSVANGDKLTIFSTNRCCEEKFELFDDGLQLALSFDDECNTDFKECDADGREKDSKALVILIADQFANGITKIMTRVSEQYNVVITNIMDDRDGFPIGFIHPVTNQLCLWQTSYHERKEMCDLLREYSHNDAFRW
jgi:hypothetical protein